MGGTLLDPFTSRQRVRWAFFDRSHARRGTWCDMAACGNMIKNRNFRARHR
jgi:predicted RNA-binding Zn ribbon-like protein